MRAEKNVPEIRFNGFSGAWLQSNLAECTDLLTGNPFNSKEFTTSGFLLVRGMNVKRGYLDTSANLSEYWPSSKGLERYLLEPEDIVIQMDGALIGKSYAKIISKNLPAILVQRVTRIRCSKVNPDLIYQYIQKDFLNHISGIKTETAVPHLSLHDIRNFPVFLPENLEQTAIGNTFQKLDSLINQHQQKHDKLSSIKKAMLEKMFPKQGGTIPEIRFKGFSGEWEEKELSELTDYANGKGHEDKQKTSGKYELINLNSISIGGGLKPSGKFIDETNSTLEKNDLVMVLSDVGHGDLLGRVALIPKSNAYVLNQRVALLRPYGNVCPLFLLYNINAHQTYFKKQGAGMSQLNISKGSVESFYSCIPEREEQTAIGNYFQKLDVLIKHHQQQITKLNNIKQACLSKMFV